jgi:predicted SAM-dependent methyltransferase
VRQEMSVENNLHIGGREPKEDWKILNIQAGPAVDFIGDICDLSQFSDNVFDRIYASHVLEHVAQTKVLGALSGIIRVLKPGGEFMVSVPDLEILSHLILSPTASVDTKFHAMRMMFGGQVDPHDFHYFGWTPQFLQSFLTQVGFREIKRVESFGLFSDTSDFKPYGFPISLNVSARK